MRDHEPLISELLERFRQEIGTDLEKYSNHVHWVFETCVMHHPLNPLPMFKSGEWY